MFNWLRSRHYKSGVGIAIADIILVLFRQDKGYFPVENINFAYGYSYYFFMKPVRRCVGCGDIVEGNGWQHPDREVQYFFEETGGEFLLGTNAEEVAACSEGCWRYFMEESFGHWRDE